MTAQITRTDDLAACHAIRRVVFIDEQAVPEELEMDDLDGEAIHLLATVDGRPAGTARLLLRDEVGKIGRVAVLADSSKFGRRLFAQVAELGRADWFISDVEPPEELTAAFRRGGVEVLTPG